MELTKLSEIIKPLLLKSENCRSSDDFLYCEVIKNIYPNILNFTAEQFFYKRKDYKIPSFESVSRCRRKLQEQYECLKPYEKIQEARTRREEEFYNWSKLKQAEFDF